MTLWWQLLFGSWRQWSLSSILVKIQLSVKSSKWSCCATAQFIDDAETLNTAGLLGAESPITVAYRWTTRAVRAWRDLFITGCSGGPISCQRPCEHFPRKWRWTVSGEMKGWCRTLPFGRFFEAVFTVILDKPWILYTSLAHHPPGHLERFGPLQVLPNVLEGDGSPKGRSLAKLAFLDTTGTRSNWSKSKLAIHPDEPTACAPPGQHTPSNPNVWPQDAAWPEDQPTETWQWASPCQISVGWWWFCERRSWSSWGWGTEMTHLRQVCFCAGVIIES